MRPIRTRQIIDPEDFQKKVAAEQRKIRESVANYLKNVKIVGAIDAGINFTWTREDSPVKVITRDRFPKIGDLTPDFLFEFDNGYFFVGECKKVWDKSRSKDDLDQLVKYRAVAGSRQKVGYLTPSDTVESVNNDVLLLVNSTDEPACEDIAADTRLGPGSIIVVDCVKEEKTSTETIRFVKRKHGAHNGAFSSPNAGPTGSDFDLNKYFSGDGASMRCDENALVLAGNCPFTNDDPLPNYTFMEIVVPLINDLLSNKQRDQLAAGKDVSIRFKGSQIAKLAVAKYERVPKAKLESWIHKAIKSLSIIGILTVLEERNDTEVSVTIGKGFERDFRDHFSSRIAKGVVRSNFGTYNRTGKGQLTFEDLLEQ